MPLTFFRKCRLKCIQLRDINHLNSFHKYKRQKLAKAFEEISYELGKLAEIIFSNGKMASLLPNKKQHLIH
ncbi:MAG: hypothetical protein MK172_05030, partial [Verrucomicrobiales bacterium]|nr:hypothetical protein [Verrucomicrobiales bacterium]